MTKTDTENEWLVSGMIIYKNTTYIATVPWPALIMDCFAWADNLARQQDEMAVGASTPALRIMFEDNARGIRLWADGDSEFDEIGRPLASMSPFLAARAQQGNLLVIPSNVEDYMKGLMERAADAKPGATLSFLFIEQQFETFGPELYASEDYDFLLRFATRGVIRQVVSKEDLSNFYQKTFAASPGEPPSVPEKSGGVVLDESPRKPSPRRRASKN